jgi:hypothetical protein
MGRFSVLMDSDMSYHPMADIKLQASDQVCLPAQKVPHMMIYAVGATETEVGC